jgi:hypothetical protein
MTTSHAIYYPNTPRPSFWVGEYGSSGKHLPSKCEVLSSNPRTTEKKKKKKMKKERNLLFFVCYFQVSKIAQSQTARGSKSLQPF